MPTASGRPSLMDAILAGEKPSNFLATKPNCDWVGDGVQSPIDGKVYRHKADYMNHLKQTGHHIIGDSLESRKEKRRKQKEKIKEESARAEKLQKEYLEGRKD